MADQCITCRREITADDPFAYAIPAAGDAVDWQCLPCGDRSHGPRIRGLMSPTLIALILALVGCGGVRVEQPKDQTYSTDGKQPSDQDKTSKETGPAAEPSSQGRDDGQNHDTAGDDVTVSVDVSVTVDRHGDGELSLINSARFAAVERSWADTQAKAPNGYRLAERSEVLAMIDAGVLQELGADNVVVWTATERDRDVAFLIDTASGRVAPMDKDMRLAALYVRDEQ